MPKNERNGLIYYCEGLETGGVTGVMQTLALSVHKAARPVVVHRNSDDLNEWLEQLRSSGVSTVPAALRNNNSLAGWFDVSGMIRLAQLFRTASILHCQCHTPFSCLPAIFLARLTGVPCIITTEHYITQLRYLRRRKLVFPISLVREAKIFLLMMLKHLSFRQIDRIVTVSHENRSFLLAQFGEGLSPKTQTITNGVDATLIRGEDKLETELPAAIHATPAATPVVAVVAGLNNQKGHRYLFEAIPSVARRHPQILFLLVGDGHLRESLKTLARELGISRHVEFLGMRHDVPSILQMSDLFVLPSLFEGMPLSVLEAMAAGKAVVATDVDGTKEVVVDGETGYLVPPRNAEQLARRIDDLLSDDDRRRLFGKQGRERVATTFTTEKMAHAYALLYQELLLHRTSGL